MLAIPSILLGTIPHRARKVISRIPPAGAGGGKSGGSGGSAPTEDPDSLQSVAFVTLLDLLGEGEIQGIVPGPTGAITDNVYLQNIPITESGFANFQGYTLASTNGTQDQAVIPGFGSVFATAALGTEVRETLAVESEISNVEANAVIMTASVSSLYNIDTSSGDIHGSSVEVVFEYLPTGMSTWIPAIDMTITGKTRSKYERSSRFELTGTGPWVVRMRRITADSTTSNLVNNTFLDAVTTVVDRQLAYPNSALVGLSIDARQFSSVPTRSYLVDGLIIRVPDNYDPDTRIYDGVWDGSFKLAYSNNPAWCLYDLITSTRYGLGNWIGNALPDKAALYEIGQYCDELVPDGFGGTEPRFVLNTVINTAKEAYQVIQDLLSVFRGMSYWASGNIFITQDAPRTPGRLFSRANVVGGKFHYEGTDIKDRYSVALVQWNDPSQLYTQNTEYVQDPEAIQRFGIKPTTIMAVGTTSRGQAHRLGQWTLVTQKSDTDQLTFTTGLDALDLTPGEIIYVADPKRSTKRIGGRILNADVNTITLDAPVVLDAGQTYEIIYYDGTGTQFTAPVENTANTTAILTFVTPVENIPQPSFMWILTSSDLVPQTFRVLNVVESARNTYDVTAVTYNASKYAAIDFNTKLQVPPTGYGGGIGAVTPNAWSLTETTFIIAPGTIGSKIIMSWSGNTTHYMIQWRVNGGIWISDTTRTPGYELDGVTKGDVYDFRVYGISSDGSLSASLEETYTIAGISAPPGACTSLTAVADFKAADLNWAAPGDLDLDYFQVGYSLSNDISTAAIIGDLIGSTSWQVGGLTSTVTYYFWVRAVDTSGNVGPWNSNVGTVCVPLQAGTLDLAALSVTNAKIGTEAVGTSNIQNAAITTALIGVAQIVTAHIGTAQVDTLQITGNAVTTQASWSMSSTDEVTYSSTGGNLAIFFTGVAGYFVGGDGPGAQGGSVRLYVNGTYSGATEGYGPVTITSMALVNPGAGTVTLQVTSPEADLNDSGLQPVQLVVFEAKR